MRHIRIVAMAGALLVVLAACGTAEEGGDTTAGDAGADTTTADTTMETEASGGDTTMAPEEGGETTAAESGTPEPLEPAGELTVGLAAIPPVFPAALDMYVAEDMGLFEKYGVDVTLRPFENGGDSARAASTGEIDIGAVPTNVGVALEAGGGDMTAIVGIRLPTWHVASTNDEIASCEDLEGTTVAVDGVGQTRYGVLGAILESCGLTIDDVETVFIHAAPVIEGLVSGQIENAVMHLYEYATVQTLLEAEGGDTTVHQIISITDIRPDQHYLYYGASADAMAEKREALVRFVAADLEARAAIADPANLDAIAELGPNMGLEPDVTRTAIELYLGLDDYWATDAPDLDQTGFDYTIQGEVEVGNVEEAAAPTYEDMVDTSVWEEARALVDSMGG
jgi:NitT/TauT family transport system substrate-binding protein